MKLPVATLSSLKSYASGEWKYSSKFIYSRHLAEVRSHFTPPRSMEGTPSLIQDDASWPLEHLWMLCSKCECTSIPPAGKWNMIRRSASPHSAPAAGVNKLPAIPTIPLVQAGIRGRPRGICSGQSKSQRGVSLRTYFFPSVSFHQVTVRVIYFSTYSTIKYNIGSSQDH